MAERSVNRQAYRVIRSLELFLETGDALKINRGLYEELTGHCGFIAHYDLHGFRRHFDGRPEYLLQGELYPLSHLRDPQSPYLYTDGLSSIEVLEQFRRIASRYLLAAS